MMFSLLFLHMKIIFFLLSNFVLNKNLDFASNLQAPF